MQGTIHDTRNYQPFALKRYKKSGRIQRFNRMKLYSGIYGATIGFDIPHREVLVEHIADDVEQDILYLKQKVDQSDVIADIVLYRLKQINTSIFLRFLAYCKNIRTLDHMNREFHKYTK